jgi:hypothetical protein
VQKRKLHFWYCGTVNPSKQIQDSDLLWAPSFSLSPKSCSERFLGEAMANLAGSKELLSTLHSSTRELARVWRTLTFRPSQALPSTAIAVPPVHCSVARQ